jgi:hypothetical protein
MSAPVCSNSSLRDANGIAPRRAKTQAVGKIGLPQLARAKVQPQLARSDH